MYTYCSASAHAHASNSYRSCKWYLNCSAYSGKVLTWQRGLAIGEGQQGCFNWISCSTKSLAFSVYLVPVRFTVFLQNMIANSAVYYNEYMHIYNYCPASSTVYISVLVFFLLSSSALTNYSPNTHNLDALYPG